MSAFLSFTTIMRLETMLNAAITMMRSTMQKHHALLDLHRAEERRVLPRPVGRVVLGAAGSAPARCATLLRLEQVLRAAAARRSPRSPNRNSLCASSMWTSASVGVELVVIRPGRCPTTVNCRSRGMMPGRRHLSLRRDQHDPVARPSTPSARGELAPSTMPNSPGFRARGCRCLMCWPISATRSSSSGSDAADESAAAPAARS